MDERSLLHQLLADDAGGSAASPGEGSGFGRVPWGWLDLIVVSLVGLVAQLALVPAGMVGISRVAGHVVHSASVVFFAQVLVWYALLMAAVWLMGLRRHHASWRDLGFRPVDRRGLAGLLVLLATTVVGVNLLARLVADPPRLQNPFMLGHGRGGMLVVAVLVIVLAPLVEETFFRGFLLQGLARRMSFWPAAIITSAVFALAHLWPYLFPPIFLLGIAFSWLFWRTGSLWTAIAAHSTLNATAFVIAWLIEPL